MGTGRTFNKKPVSRPKKGLSERNRRLKNQKKRLIALGVSEESMRTMNPGDIRELLRRPALLQKD